MFFAFRGQFLCIGTIFYGNANILDFFTNPVGACVLERILWSLKELGMRFAKIDNDVIRSYALKS